MMKFALYIDPLTAFEHSYYTKELLADSLQTPYIESNRSSVWAQYTVRVNNRNNVQARLKNKGIPTAVHYPMPLHLQECFQYLDYKQGDFPISEQASEEVMSLPMNPFLSIKEIKYIANQLI